jgi:hypothetical protein
VRQKRRRRKMSEKKQYAVTLPVAGSIMVWVEAASEEEALDLAFEKQDWSIETGESTEAGEFESLKRIVTGNCCHAPCWEYSVEEQK